MVAGKHGFMVFVYTFAALLLFAGCAGGRNTGWNDEDVQWFLEQHDDLKAKYFVGKFGVDNNPSGWDHGAYLRAYIDMYEATHDIRILRNLNELLKIVADGNDALTGRADDRTNTVLPGWGTREYDYGPNGGERYSDMLTNALFAYPLAAFARIVYEHPHLRSEFGADADRYYQMVRELYQVHAPVVRDARSPYSDGTEGMYYAYPENYYEERENLSGVEAPINITAIIAEPLVELYQASVAAGQANEEYRNTVEKVGHYIWQNMRLETTEAGDAYLVWYYWPADIHPETRRMEDPTHGARVAEFAVSLYDAGLRSRWTKEKLQYLANTFTCGVAIGGNKFANYIDGTGGIYEDDAATLYEWLVLQRYSYTSSRGTIKQLLTSAIEAEGEDAKYNLAVFAKLLRYGSD